MKIVVTNPSGLTETHIETLRNMSDVEVYTDTNQSNYKERLQNADIAVIDCFLTPVTKEFLSNTPSLKYFSINSTGYDKVDVGAVKDAQIVASNVPEFSTGSVAELAIGLMFTVVRKIVQCDKKFRSGLYAVDPGTQESDRYIGFNLEGKTLGVVGLGKIGERVAQIGKGIGMNVVAYNRNPKDISGIQNLPLEEIVQRADILIVCLALNKDTTGLITKDLISKMRKSAIFVSIASMKIVDQDALIDALNNELISGAGIDTGSDKFLNVKNTVLTPHIGYNTHESNENMGRIILENIEAYIANKPINIIP